MRFLAVGDGFRRAGDQDLAAAAAVVLFVVGALAQIWASRLGLTLMLRN